MPIEFDRLHPLFVAEATGVDLSQPMDAETLRTIWDAIDRYAVVVFHGQRLTDAQLRDFAARFGDLEIGRAAARGGRRRLAIPQIGDISNLDEDNQVRAMDDRRRLDSLGNRLWHTDASYMPVPVVLGMLHAVTVPPASALGGGETEFADMRAAYDAFRMRRRRRSTGLSRSTTCSGRAARSASPNSHPASANNTRHRRSDWCGCIRDRSARRSICPRTHRTSLAGRLPMAGCCCSI
jgi:alpha-ketoglutarate-dependent taurine dioxygenase